MAFVTAAADGESFSYETREEAIVKAVELVKEGGDEVMVTDEESGETLSGEDLLAAIDDLVDGEEPA